MSTCCNRRHDRLRLSSFSTDFMDSDVEFLSIINKRIFTTPDENLIVDFDPY